MKRIDFYCTNDRQDYTLLAEELRLNSEIPMAWQARCPDCGKPLVRYTTGPVPDPYARQSKKQRTIRRKHADDLMQVDHKNFDMMYPEHKKKREAYYEKKERTAWQNQKSAS